MRATAAISSALRGSPPATAGSTRGALRELEPSLDGRFREGLFYPDEGHVEPRRVLPELHARIAAAGGRIKFDSDGDAADLDGIVIDCRGLAARDTSPSCAASRAR